MTSKAEELWEKYSFMDDYGHKYLSDPSDFFAALREYGAEVRKRDAEICHNHAFDQRRHSLTRDGALSCKAAIELEEFP
jgi:hypothetical protein